MRKDFADKHARLSKPDAKELGARNRESGLQGVVQVYDEQLDTDAIPSGAAWIEPLDGVPQIMAKGQDGTTYQLPIEPAEIPPPPPELVPIGGTIMWSGTSDPAGGQWFICDGRTLSTSLYADLFAVCSTAWNTGGEPVGTFRIPDMRSRVPVGAGMGTGLTNRVLSSEFGEESHDLGISEMPSHAHTASGGNHSHPISGGGAHSHTGSVGGGNHVHGSVITGVSSSFSLVASGSGTNMVSNTTASFGNSGATTPSMTVTVDSGGSDPTITPVSAVNTIANTGGGLSHNNMQPSLAINFILRAL